MKKIWPVFFIILLLLTGCQSRISNTDDKLMVGLNDEFIPFEYRDENEELEGFDIDLANALADKLGLELEITTVDFEALLDGLNEDKYEVVISAISKTKERMEDYDLSEPYIANGLVLITKPGQVSPAKTYAELSGKTVGVQKGTAANDAAEKYHDSVGENVNVNTFETGEDLYGALKNGEIDYILDDVGVAAYYVNTDPQNYVVSSEEVFTNEPLVIAVKKGNKELLEKVNTALDELRSEGILAQISTKWFGNDWTSNIDTEVRSVDENIN